MTDPAAVAETLITLGGLRLAGLPAGQRCAQTRDTPLAAVPGCAVGSAPIGPAVARRTLARAGDSPPPHQTPKAPGQ